MANHPPAMQAPQDAGLIPGLQGSPGEGSGIPLQYSCQDNPTDRGAWWATVHGVTKSQTRLRAGRHSDEDHHQSTAVLAVTAQGLISFSESGALVHQ